MKFQKPKDHVLEKYKKLRKDHNDYLILESEKVILYAHKMDFTFEEIIANNDFYKEHPNINAKAYYILEKHKLKEIIGYNSHGGVFALIKKPAEKTQIADRVLILDNLTSPENVGSICRSASAFGFNTVIYNSKGVSPYLRRCIRVSTGHVLNLNILKSSSIKNKICELKENNYNIISCHNSKQSKDLEDYSKNIKKLCLIIGSEGHGISDDLIKLSNVSIKIKTHENVEHLNASNASSIIMHYFKKY